MIYSESSIIYTSTEIELISVIHTIIYSLFHHIVFEGYIFIKIH